MSDNLEQFDRCVNSKTKDGRVSVECKLGLWSVEAADSDQVNAEAFHCWNQYAQAGEYYKIIGGKSPAEVMMKAIRREPQ